MTNDHVPACIDLWVSQFKEARENLASLPVLWSENTNLVQSYLREHVKKGFGVVARSQDKIVGYMTYDRFNFHGEETTISPIIGHASVSHCRPTVYRVLYRHLSSVWVSDCSLNHIITAYTSDSELVDTLFHLGFGVYVVDAFRDNSPIIHTGAHVKVREAVIDDLDEIKRLGDESRLYYLQPPVFLVRKQESKEYYASLLEDEDGKVLLAEIDDQTVGVLYVRVNDESDVYSLAAMGIGKIDKMGVYIQGSARGLGAGNALLNAAVEWCRKRNIETIHVDYESANLFGGGFWLKHFSPALYSLRRKVNQDILG